MSGKDVYTRTIEFSNPAYLPSTVDVDLDWLRDKDEAKRERVRELVAGFPDDLLGGITAAARETRRIDDDGVTRWRDEWQTGWADDGNGAKTVSYPLIDGYEALAGYDFPDPQRPGRFAAAHERLRRRGDRYTRSLVWFTLFERLWMLRGFENMLMDPYLHERDFCSLRDRIVDYNVAVIDEWIRCDVDAVYFSDDWGWQRGLLIRPDDWRRFYRPAYQRMFDRVRSGGAHVWMHLCGDVSAILLDLVDLGLNVLNPVSRWRSSWAAISTTPSISSHRNTCRCSGS